MPFLATATNIYHFNYAIIYNEYSLEQEDILYCLRTYTEVINEHKFCLYVLK